MTITLPDLQHAAMVLFTACVLLTLCGGLYATLCCHQCGGSPLYAARRPLSEKRLHWYCRSCCRAIDSARRVNESQTRIRRAVSARRTLN